MEFGDILKYDSEEGCASCFFVDECMTTSRPGPSICNRRVKKHVEKLINKHMWHYANANQLEEKIADAEAGNHAWVRENTLFVCKSSNPDCHPVCNHKEIHSYSVMCSNACTYAVCTPYRGERTAEDYTAVEEIPLSVKCGSCFFQDESGICFGHAICCNHPAFKSKKELYDNEHKEDSDDMGDVEYVVLKDFSLEDLVLLKDIITDSDFRDMFTKWTCTYKEGRKFYNDDPLCNYIGEFEECGFIGEVVVDPVVYEGDTFKSCDPDGPYRIVVCGKDSYLLSSIDGTYFYGGIKQIPKGEDIRLSMFVGEDLYKFTPCKVKVEVVG